MLEQLISEGIVMIEMHFIQRVGTAVPGVPVRHIDEPNSILLSQVSIFPI